jgi:hypothetical protein
VLEEVALLFDTPPDPFVLVVRVPAAFDGAAVGLAEVNNLVFVGMEYAVEGQVILPTIGRTRDLRPASRG